MKATFLNERGKVLTGSSRKLPSGDGKERSIFEPRPFAPPVWRTDSSPESVGGSDLHESYPRQQRLGFSFGLLSGSGESPIASSAVQPSLKWVPQVAARAVGQAVERAPTPVQRITARKDKIWSTFREDVMIDENQAVITAASQDSMTGGHSTVVLEYQETDGLARATLIDLIVNGETWVMEIRIRDIQEESPPATGLTGVLASAFGMNEREVRGTLNPMPLSASHIIRGTATQGVIARAERLKGSINNDYYYSTSGYRLPTHFLEKGTPINCAIFASMLLDVAGVEKSSVVPSNLASATSTAEETGARFGL